MKFLDGLQNISMLLKKLFISWKISFNECIDPFRGRLIFNLKKKNFSFQRNLGAFLFCR